MAERDLDAVTGRVTAELLRRSHLMRPDQIGEALAEAARPLGVTAVRVYLADLQQRQLALASAGDCRDADALPIDSTLSGHAFQTVTVQLAPVRDADGPGPGERPRQVWIPLVDGTERLGVLELTAADVSPAMLERYRTLASLAAILIIAKASYNDAYARAQRSRPMAPQAELVWAFLPPRTFATERVLVAAMLEPAYEAGGDAFDYALTGDHLHVAIFDALGHDLHAGLLASVGMAACRAARRSGGPLAAIAASADDAIARFFGGDRFMTALLCDLDLGTGLFTWIPCGHPPPLLVRGGSARELDRVPRPPLGLRGIPGLPGAGPDDPAWAPLHTERLQPGDRLLLYTDGVTEGRAADGTWFGLDRLAGFVTGHSVNKNSSPQLPAPEVMRRLNHAIFGYQHGRLRDDATAVLVEWQPDHPGHALVP